MATQLTFADARPRPRDGPRLWVLPDSARVEEKLVQLATPFVAGRVACTLAELEQELLKAARRAGACPAVPPPCAVPLLLRELCREATPPGSSFFGIRAQPGFAAAVGELLAALGQGMLEPADLLRLAPELLDANRERVEPLARILCSARDALDGARLAEPARALAISLRAIESGLPLPALVAGKAELVFDAILDWTPLRLRLVATLAARGVRVRVRLPWSAGRPELTEALEPALRAFEVLGANATAAPELELFDPAEGSPLAPFLGRLFAQAAERAELGEIPRQRVSLNACASPSAQAREVAKACADLLAACAAPDSIAVVARRLGGGVAEELSAAFDRLGLPLRERRGRPALPSPPVQLALLSLDLIDRDFPREGLELLLSSDLLRLREPGERLRPQALARRLRQAQVRNDAEGTGEQRRGGVSARLAQLAARVQEKARREGKDASRDLAEIEETRRRAQRAIDALRGLPERATLREHGAALLALLRRWGLPRRLRRPEPETMAAVTATATATATSNPTATANPNPIATPTSALARASALALARDQAALRALEEACEQLAEAADRLGMGSRPYGRAEFREALAMALSQASLPPGGARGGAVHLTELRELPGRSFAHVLVVGMIDGELPARPRPDALLTDDDRRALNRAAKRAVFRAQGDAGEPALLAARQAEEPLLFHLGLCSARESVGLFWTRTDAKGAETLRSPFVDEAMRALGLGASEEEACEVRLSPIPAAPDCRAPGELLARVALEAFAEPAFRVSPPLPQAQARALAAAAADSSLAPRLSRAARAAMAEGERLRAFVGEAEPGRFSGRIGGAALSAALPLLRFSAEAPLSAHWLEQHALCGFRTLGHRLLGVKEEAQAGDDIDYRERGTLLHRCLEAFFRRMRDEGRLPLRGGEDELPALREVAAAEIEAFAAEEHVGRSALWELRREEVLTTLVRLLESEAKAQGRPLEFELAFGFDEPGSWEALRVPDPTGGETAFARGLIDRVDEGADGSLLVLDYKSGGREALRRKLAPSALFAPEFQLLLYAAAVRQRNPRRGVDAAYLSLRDAQRSATLRATAQGALDLDALLEMDPERRAELRAAGAPNLADAIWQIVERMRAGSFPVAPRSCDFCDLTAVCRIVALPAREDATGEANGG